MMNILASRHIQNKMNLMHRQGLSPLKCGYFRVINIAFKTVNIHLNNSVSDGLQRVEIQPVRRRLACSATWAPPPRAPQATIPRARAVVILQAPALVEILQVPVTTLQPPALTLRTQAIIPQAQVTNRPVQNIIKPVQTAIYPVPDTTHQLQNTTHPVQTAICPVPATIQPGLTLLVLAIILFLGVNTPLSVPLVARLRPTAIMLPSPGLKDIQRDQRYMRTAELTGCRPALILRTRIRCQTRVTVGRRR